MDLPPHLSVTQLIENMHEGVLITDPSGCILAVNSTFCKVTGYSAEEVIGKNPRILRSGKHTPIFYKKMWETIKKDGFWQGEICNRKKNGHEYIEWLTISSIKNSKGELTNYLGVTVDITRQKRAEETIRHMAYYDPLTNLPNRALFRDRLKQALSFSHRNKKLLGVLFLDLDRMKIINDTLGHDIGDKLLRQVSQRMEACLREGDTIARLGGDEFMLILPEIKELKDITIITEKILESLKPSFLIDGHELHITASIGISIFPNDAKDPASLLKNADTAMYRAKRQGRNNYQVFTSSMKDDIAEQLSVENSLRHALEREEFVVYYQPQINTLTGEIIGAEALVRWQHPVQGLVPPKRFIHWAEDTGLIIPLGEWVLRKALAQAKQWQDIGFPHLRMSVNLSAMQVHQKNLSQVVGDILDKTGMAPESVELEITESVVMENSGAAVMVPHELRAMGLRLSIDDFGTGYSSLNYLKRLPVNTLKMDQSFIHDIAEDSHNAAIAEAVIMLGHGLHLSVVAEGVENEAQLTFLRNRRCDSIQGFYFSEPVPAHIFGEILRKQRPLENAGLFGRD